MTVAELIKDLKRFDGDTVVGRYDEGCVWPASRVKFHRVSPKKNLPNSCLNTLDEQFETGQPDDGIGVIAIS